MASYVTNSICT